MVTHDEEAHALLDEFELANENPRIEHNAVSSSSASLKSQPRSKIHRAKRPCRVGVIATLIVVTLLFAFEVTVSLTSGERKPLENDAGNHLGFRLHPNEHIFRPPTTLVFNWNVTTGIRSPDGVEKLVYLINDEFPGPIIEARSGDRIEVHVQNSLQEDGVSLHWHGLRMRDQNLMDGAVGLTQCPIPSGSSFVYNFTIGDEERGTFWWHSHSDVQRADGLWGGLIVHYPEETSAPQEDYLVMVGDWFHRNQTEVLAWYADASSRGNEPVPDSLLLNGRGRFNCSMAVPARPVVCTQVVATELKPLFESSDRGAMRLRVVNTGSISGFTMRIDGATMQPLRVDGGFDVSSQTTETVGIICPGERVDIAVKWGRDDSVGRQLTIFMDDENFGYPNPALNPTQTFPVFHDDFGVSDLEQAHQDLEPGERQILDSQNIKAATRVSGMPAKAEQTFVLYAKTEKLAHMDYEPVGFINHTSWKPQNPPLLAQNRSAWDDNQLIPFISMSPDKPTRVDIIINNLDDGAHPFHLHGHSFYVLSSYKEEGRGGWGSYNPYDGRDPPNGLNLDFPVRKDTVSVPRRGHVVLALLADNPGIWALHCHMLVHMARGMAMGFHVGNSHDEEHIKSADTRAGELCMT